MATVLFILEYFKLCYMKFKLLFAMPRALVRAAACVAKAERLQYFTVKGRSRLPFLWITKLYIMHWKKNLSILHCLN
ncbi:putative 50S ribosomal protein L25 [Neisseria musculi]|uniref:50S ribosomal protein L25 n=1 Tax=Neisseria musculi TaxID=1815583 RepID=A0A7H1MEG0_9NEIS|nr:putative 50S ribosomal protein L25 [Neisseria musculi]